MAKYQDRRHKELLDLGSKLFTKKIELDDLNQEIAWQFAPDLATFTRPMQLGEDFMSDHMDSVPVQTSRELSNQLAANLRPQDRFWFKSTTLDDDADADEANAQFLDYIAKKTWRGIYDPRTQMIAASKEADRFYTNFGGCVMSVNEAPGAQDHLLFKNFHIKDCVYLENDLGVVDHLHRRQSMTARALNRRFGGERDNLHKSIKLAATREPDREFEIRVVTMPADEYGEFTGAKNAGGKMPFVICYMDVENGCIIRDSGLITFNYIVPRWHRFAGSQYPFSPAAMTALPDARMAQMLSQILLDAGEKAVDPPLIGKQEIVIGEPNIMAGAISWVDMEHDGKLTDALEVLKIDADMRVGFEMRKDVREMLARAFYLDKLSMPETGDRTTAYEVSRALETHARNMLPLFEPMQVEYNTAMLDISFAFLVNMKKIDLSKAPESLHNSPFTWAFESPIQQARYRVMVEQFRDTLQVVAAAKEMGLMASPIHLDRAVRDAVRGVDGPAIWRKTVEEQQAEQEANDAKAKAAEAINAVGAAGAAASQVGDAGQKLGLIPPGGPLMPSQNQAIPSNTGVPSPGPTGSITPSNAMRSLQEQLGQLQGGGAGEAEAGGESQQAQLPAPAGAPPPAQGGAAMATPQGSIAELITMQRRMMRQLADLEAAVREPRHISVERDSKGKIKGAKASHGSKKDTDNQRVSA